MKWSLLGIGPAFARVAQKSTTSRCLNKHLPSIDHQIPSYAIGAMAPLLIHLPNGQTLTVTPVFAGFSFKSNDLNVHNSAFPPGWTIIIESQEDEDDEVAVNGRDSHDKFKQDRVHRYRHPTLHSDRMFISSISNPSSTDFKPATSPTRQIAMMLWATLWWYFHQVYHSDSTERVPRG